MPIPVRLIAGRPATILIAVLLQACARATPTPVPAPAAPPLVVPAPVVQPPITVSPVPAAPPAPAAADTARTDWHRLDYDSDRVLGVGSERALRELLAGRQPQREVLVAVIDGGIDTAHTYLRGRLWRNAREVAGNGRDDDANGYTDDVWGWNFMVTPSG